MVKLVNSDWYCFEEEKQGFTAAKIAKACLILDELGKGGKAY